MPKPQWYDPETDPSQFMAALWKVRHLCTSAEHVRMTAPGSYILVQAIMSAIDDYAENETGNREYFWNRPHKAGLTSSTLLQNSDKGACSAIGANPHIGPLY